MTITPITGCPRCGSSQYTAYTKIADGDPVDLRDCEKCGCVWEQAARGRDVGEGSIAGTDVGNVG